MSKVGLCIDTATWPNTCLLSIHSSQRYREGYYQENWSPHFFTQQAFYVVTVFFQLHWIEYSRTQTTDLVLQYLLLQRLLTHSSVRLLPPFMLPSSPSSLSPFDLRPLLHIHCRLWLLVYDFLFPMYWYHPSHTSSHIPYIRPIFSSCYCFPQQHYQYSFLSLTAQGLGFLLYSKKFLVSYFTIPLWLSSPINISASSWIFSSSPDILQWEVLPPSKIHSFTWTLRPSMPPFVTYWLSLLSSKITTSLSLSLLWIISFSI